MSTGFWFKLSCTFSAVAFLATQAPACCQEGGRWLEMSSSGEGNVHCVTSVLTLHFTGHSQCLPKRAARATADAHSSPQTEETHTHTHKQLCRYDVLYPNRNSCHSFSVLLYVNHIYFMGCNSGNASVTSHPSTHPWIIFHPPLLDLGKFNKRQRLLVLKKTHYCALTVTEPLSHHWQ